MKQIKQIDYWDVDQDGNNRNFWVLLDKINELVEAINELNLRLERIRDIDVA